MIKRMLPINLYSSYPSSWNIILDKYLEYCKKIKINSENSIKIKRDTI